MVRVRNAWYVAAWSQELAIGKPMTTSIINDLIVLYRKEDGTPVALSDRCVHRQAPLSRGRCEGNNLRCMYHGLLFDPTGQVIAIPGQDIIPPQAKVRSYPVVERSDWIWIWMGEDQAADPALIPHTVGPGDPDYLMGWGALNYDADARLINENLLDFSHLGFVHPNSFGVGDEWSNTPMRVEPLERGIRFERWLPNSVAPAFTGAGEQRIDGFITYDFVVPGVLVMWSGNFPLGTAEKCGFGRPEFGLASGNVARTSQAVTPLTDKTARYLFCTGPSRQFGNEQIRDVMVKVTLQAFEEDKEIIEAQQFVLDQSPSTRIMPTIHDRGSIMFQRILDRMIKAEAEVSAKPQTSAAA